MKKKQRGYGSGAAGMVINTQTDVLSLSGAIFFESRFDADVDADDV
jgi:hypothetical protein